MVIWITGLSGAGKSTIAREVAAQLRAEGQPTLLLDGDAVREALADGRVGHDPEARLINAWRIARLAKLAADQGLTVVVATMSLFKEIHAWNRAHQPAYCEVYVRVPLDTLVQRDARGLYSRAARGEARDVAGYDLPFDEPSAPHLILDNHLPDPDIPAFAQRILKARSS